MKKFIFSLSLIMLTFSAYSQNSFEVKKTGKGAPILLFPGFSCTSDVFKEVIPILSANYEVHAFTFAGFGGVPPISFPWLPQIKSGIETYVQEHNLNHPIIIGHSLGGTLGLWLAADSKSISNLIIIDALPAMGALMIPDFNADAIGYDSAQNTQILQMEEEAFRQMAVQNAAFMTANAEKQKEIANWITTADRETYVYGFTDLLKLDLRESLNKIESPVHILAATLPYGREMAEANYRKQYENLENYTLKFAEGSGHFIMYDQFNWLMEALHNSLAKDE